MQIIRQLLEGYNDAAAAANDDDDDRTHFISDWLVRLF